MMTTTGTDAFRQYVRACLETETGSAALEKITTAHEATVTGLAAQVTGHQQDAAAAQTAARMRAEMLTHAERVLGAELRHGAALHARLGTARQCLARVQQLVTEHQADGAEPAIPVDQLAEAIADGPVPPMPTGPWVVAYIADPSYQTGQFTSADQVVMRTLPFTGWMLLAPAPAGGAVEAAFLVDGQVLGVTAIAQRYGLRLQQLL